MLFLEQFLAYSGCFRLFTKTKKGCRTSFWCTCSGSSFHEKRSLLNTLSINKVQCCIFFPSQDIKQDALLSSYLENCLRHML